MKSRNRFFKKEKSTFKLLSRRLENRRKELIKEFEEKHQDSIKWLEEKGIDVDEVLNRTSKGALAGLAVGMVMFSSGAVAENTPKSDFSQPDLESVKIVSDLKGKMVIENLLLSSLRNILPRKTKTIQFENEQEIVNKISEISGVKISAELEGNRLNTNYGRIGLEQHLPRFPGETIHDHLSGSVSKSRYERSGMTRNRGAFGYFAFNKLSLNQEAIDQEKYYVVIQTFAIPGYSKNKKLVDWYKHRKVMVINPENGKAVIGDIADSGPAIWTGKSFGGSPELMDQLGMYPGEKKTPVLMFFVDESSSSQKLGPI